MQILMLLRTIINTICIKFIVILLLATSVACHQPQNQVIKRQLFVFGTLIDISIWADDETLASQAVTEISEQFNQMHNQWHAWKPGRLNQINQLLRQGDAVPLSNEEAYVLKSSLDLSLRSHGHFNPLMGEVINLWGFHSDEYPLLSPPPAENQVEYLLNQAPQIKDLIWQNNILMSQNQHVWFDLGGMAKGYAVDVATQILQSHGLNHSIVNAGGDLRVQGKKGGQQHDSPWTIAIQSPTNWQPVALITPNGNEAIFTSGNYRRYKAFDGKRYAHIIDPFDYQPVSDIVAATVIAQDGMLADAAATALVVAGNGWAHIANQMGIKEALVIDKNDRCFATHAMLERLSELSITCETPKPTAGSL